MILGTLLQASGLKSRAEAHNRSRFQGSFEVVAGEAFKHSDTYESLVNSFIEDIEEDEEAEPEDAATRMRRMFASRGTESLELFEAGFILGEALSRISCYLGKVIAVIPKTC